MEIIFYHQTFDTPFWIRELEKQLPGARVREWKAGDNQPADYALVWQLYPAHAFASGSVEITNMLTMRWSGIHR